MPEEEQKPAQGQPGTANSEPGEASLPNDQENSINIHLPVLPSPQVIQDGPSGMTWIGLPLAKMEPLDMVIILDQMKSHCLAWFKKPKVPKIVRPGFNQALQNTKEFLLRKWKH